MANGMKVSIVYILIFLHHLYSLVHSVPTITRLAVSSTTRWHLESLSNSIRKIDLRLLPQFDSDGQGGVNREEFEEAKESLLDMYDVYNE